MSNAVALGGGPALATSFNLSIAADGRVSHSSAISLAGGALYRCARVAGRVGTAPHRPATAFAAELRR